MSSEFVYSLFVKSCARLGCAIYQEFSNKMYIRKSIKKFNAKHGVGLKNAPSWSHVIRTDSVMVVDPSCPLNECTALQHMLVLFLLKQFRLTCSIINTSTTTHLSGPVSNTQTIHYADCAAWVWGQILIVVDQKLWRNWNDQVKRYLSVWKRDKFVNRHNLSSFFLTYILFSEEKATKTILFFRILIACRSFSNNEAV